ncbi:transcriptional regulator, ArsR family [Candidatus Accumulibacter phosphatis]|uniref:Transcriptional regulator, ArsR family n=2 Tax=Candidatus Accumulibacter TaxID=327159 RepID=C7RJW0_ACCRE
MDSRKEKILSILAEGEKPTAEIYEHMGVSKVYVYRLLNDLLVDGQVVQRKDGRHAHWSLSSAAH